MPLTSKKGEAKYETQSSIHVYPAKKKDKFIYAIKVQNESMNEDSITFKTVSIK